MSPFSRFSVTKNFLYGGAHWPDAGFTFTLAYDGSSTEAMDGQAAIQAPSLSNPSTVTITKTTASSRESFGEVTFAEAGTYKFIVSEAVPGEAKNNAGVTWSDATPEQKDSSDWFMLDGIRYYHKPSVVTAVVSEVDGALRLDNVTYNANDESLTVENTYAGKVGFQFNKVWLKPDATLPASEFVAWPTNETIDLVLKRFTKNGSNGYDEDTGFAVRYQSVGAEGTSVEPASVTVDGTTTQSAALSDETKAAYTLARTTTLANLYGFSIPATSLESLDANGNQYVYRLIEMDAADTEHDEFALVDASGQVYATSRKYAEDEGVVVNRDNTTRLHVTKVWQDVQGVQERAWPSNKNLSLTLHWSTEGGVSGSQQLDPVGGGTSGKKAITIDGTSYAVEIAVTNDNPALITIEGLPYEDASHRKYVYSIEEAALSGYMSPTYNNLASQSTSQTFAYDGATITNRATPAMQTVPFEVTKRLVESTNTSVEVPDTLWPEEGFSFTLNYVGYKEQDNATGDYDQEFSRSGYYDATGYPLLAMPSQESISIKANTKSEDSLAEPDRKAKFGAVKFFKAGTYYFTITEGATTDYYRTDAKGARKVKVTVADENGVLTAKDPVYYDDAEADPLSSPTFTNQYKAKADVTFSKIWLGSPSAVTADKFDEWPADKAIVVKLVRYDGNARDESFELTYAIGQHDGENDAKILPTAIKLNGSELSETELAAQPETYALTRSVAEKVFSYASAEAFDRKSVATGLDYQYFLTEEKVEGYADPLYGTLSGDAFKKRADADGKVKSGGIIANAKDMTGGAELPSTGGDGAFTYWLGGIAALACAFLLVRFKPRNC